MSAVVVANQPGVYLVDADGNIATLADGATIGSAEGFLIAGKDGSVARFAKVSSASRLVTDGSEVTQPVSAAALPLPAGASTEATLAAIKAKTDNLDVALSTRAVTGLTDVELRAAAVPVSAAALPLPTGAATQTTLAALLSELSQKTEPTDTQAISAATLPLPAGAATQATLATIATQATVAAIQAVLEAIRDTAGIKKITDQLPAGTNNIGDVDVVSSALPTGAATQTTLAAIDGKLPAALVGGRLDENLGAWLGSTAPTVGQKAMASSVPVAVSSDQSPIPVTQNPSEEATFTALVKAVAPGNGKSLLALFNPAASGYVIKLREIYIRNAAIAAVTGIAAEIGTYAIRAGGAALSAGTDVTPIAHDSNDALPAGLICKTGGTVAGESTPELDVMRISTDEWGPGTLDQEGAQQTISNYLPARVKRDAIQKPFTVRAGQGIHLKFVSNSTAGLLDIILIFTKAAA